MIVSNQEIAIYLKNIRNLSGYTNAKFICRISVSQQTSNKQIHAIPVNIIQKQSIKTQNRSQFDQHSFITKAFALKMGAHAELNQIYIFKLAVPLDSHTENSSKIIVNIQLIQIDSIKNKIMGTYKGIMHRNSINSYMEVDFYDGNPCQILGTIHSCAYKFQFHHEEQVVDLKSFCQKYCKYNIDQILEYLKNESSKNKNSLVQNYRAIYQRPLKINSMDIASKRFLKHYQKDIAERQTQFTSDDQETIAQQQKIQQKTKRRKIFSTIKEQKSQRYQIYQSILHQNAQNIYSLWRELLVSLFSIEGDKFIYHHRSKYHKKLKEKVGQSIARFKGSWDHDIYCQQQDLRSKLAYQLRNKDEFYEQEVENHNTQVYNQIFFSKVRPIFFEQKAQKINLLERQQPEDILVVLVHGLGACRLDMQKIKVELRRYYDSKIRFYTSSTNEGRTQGDIQTMGQRLAAELDYQFIKYSNLPKICFLGHSMGGLIIRTALPRLEKYKQYFHSFITLSSPHLGYTYSTSKLVDAGLWFLNAMKKCTSILQMTMQDNEIIQETFLYKLSKKPGLEWFKKIILLASYQDLYVPYHSARIQKNNQSMSDAKKQNKKGIIYTQMIQNLLNRVNNPIIRLNVNFCIPEQNFDNLIGRAAHISFINNVQMARTLVLSGHHYFF